MRADTAAISQHLRNVHFSDTPEPPTHTGTAVTDRWVLPDGTIYRWGDEGWVRDGRMMPQVMEWIRANLPQDRQAPAKEVP